MHRNGKQYEYIAVYVDDIAFALFDPQTFIDTLKNKYNFKIKEAGPQAFHLGADFSEMMKAHSVWHPKSTLRD